MRKYLAFFKVALQNRLEYRWLSLIWFVWDVLPPIIMLMFWQAAFASKSEIAGYNISSMLIYYLLVMFIRSVVYTYPGIHLQGEIVTGRLSTFYLVKPGITVIFKFLSETASKVLRFTFVLPLIGIFLLLYPFSLADITVSLTSFFMFLIFIIFTYILTFLLRFTIGLAAFWFNESLWLISLMDFLLLLFGGSLFPLVFLPKTLYNISLFLPFRFQVFVPTQIFLNQLNFSQFLGVFFIQLCWIVFFFWLVKTLWRKGLKIYSTYGG